MYTSVVAREGSRGALPLGLILMFNSDGINYGAWPPDGIVDDDVHENVSL